MNRKLTALPIVLAVALGPTSPAVAQDPTPSPDAQAEEFEPEQGEVEKLWPGMWLFNSKGKPAIHLGFSDRSETWSGLVYYLEHHDAGIRKSAVRWLEALAEDARPALAHLVRALDDEDPGVRGAAERALDAVDAGWRDRSADELAELGAALPREVRIEGTVLSFGSVLDPRRRVFPIQHDARFGLEIEVEEWWGRPRSNELGVELGEALVFGIHSPTRFSVLHLQNKNSDEIRGQHISLVFQPSALDDGAWSFRLEKVELAEVISF